MYNEELARAVIADRVREREIAMRRMSLFASHAGRPRRRTLRSVVPFPTFSRDVRTDGAARPATGGAWLALLTGGKGRG